MKTKTILILALATCFAFAGCSEDTGDSFKPAQTVPASQTDITSSATESQTETTTETTTESNTTTTEPTTTMTEAETTTTKQAAKSLTAPEKAFANGKISLSATADPETGMVIVTLKNNSKKEAKLFGNPSIVTTDGKSVQMDPYDNMQATAATVPAGSSADMTFSIDTQYITPGFKLSGELWGMDLLGVNKSYTIVFQ